MKNELKLFWSLVLKSLWANKIVIVVGIIGAIRTIWAIVANYIPEIEAPYSTMFSYGFLSYFISFAICSGVLKYKKIKKQEKEGCVPR